MKKIKIKLNGKSFTCDAGQTVMGVARENGVDIPGLCGHPDFPMKGNCRLCVVEVKGARTLQTACTTAVADGMEVMTDTERVKKARNTNLELIYAEHIEKCPECIWRFQCPLLATAQKYGLKITTFKDRKGRRKIYRFANAVEIDGTQCVDCRNCVDACSQMQKINYLELAGKGADQEIIPTKNKKIECILCGQCTVHCPVSAAQEQQEWQGVEETLKDKKGKVMVVQFAPSVRVAIGEDFGLPYGRVVTENLVASLRALGFDYVFDVSFAADITTVVEAEELLERLSGATKEKIENLKSKIENPLPMITSCCPGWVNYLEIYHPELIPNLTTSRSPHIHGGGAIKTYWAEKMKIDPKKIVVVSVMPCTAKKYEVVRSELKINPADSFRGASGTRAVDRVITTRELSFLLKKNKIDLAKIKKSKADDPLGNYTGAGVIFGGSGGVMESALRTAHLLACGDKKSGACASRVDFKEVRGLSGVKEAKTEVGGKKLRVAVVSGIGYVEPVLENLKNYDYIEVMACPGGCIGGGGQPIPTTQGIREKRIAALYRADKGRKVRISYENKGVRDILGWIKKQGHEFEHSILHTTYKKREKY